MSIGIHHYFEFFALIVALISARKLSKSFLFAVVPYLLITLISELLANYFYFSRGYATGWIYNILNLISHVFYSYVFYKYSASMAQRNAIISLTSAYVLISFVYYLQTSFLTFSHHIIASGGVIQSLFACFFFFEYLRNDSFVKKKHYTCGLFIAAGVLIFYSGIIICFSLYNYIRANGLSVLGLPLYNIIPRYLSVILYCCISIGLSVWRNPRTT